MTHHLILFFATFSAAFMATVPPGLLNLNAAKVSVEKGKSYGVIFSLGVASMIVIQAFVAVWISKFLFRNPEVIVWLQKAALIVFGFFAIYFFVLARKNAEKPVKLVQVSRKNSFFKGMLLAALNFLTIPYYSALNAMWNASGWIKFEFWDIAVFIVAAGSGSFVVLYLYTVYFTKLEARSTAFSKNSNYILSILMLVLLVITLIRIFYT
ncbi:Threonine/homoserine/homoserine lactone efflux protein [Robiginitalea myxolifaciens]|uniref:Threonine/homoserine/homoserine lactone efflux protein n=1 Tax=Robiginitalea myxolifaciens TaxID=400055 RepID=A0A1I6G929_9FLAO|nr:LysE family transporter [Robiginitalea myxolifaciens]SFR38685.1 Threonine/homoserine/homoserine lactone efflux protein [Robiginitalea myxolifaciens]